MSDLLGFSGQILMLALIALGSAAVALAVRHQRHWPLRIAPAPACLAAGSALAIAVATLTRRSGARSPGRLQLEPLRTITSYLDDPSALIIYVLGNVALFMPLGLFLFLALRRGLLAPALLTVLGSITVEVMQLPIWSRSTDVDDVLLNSAGGILGVLAGAVLVIAIPGLSPSADGRRRWPHQAWSPDPERELPTLLPLGERPYG